MASSIFLGQITKDTDQEKVNAYKSAGYEQGQIGSYKPVDVSRIVKDKIRFRDGSVKEISPAKIASVVQYMLDDMRENSYYSFLRPYIKKPIIWTYEAKTAFTDGIRVYMSPVFAYILLSYAKGKNSEATKFWDSLSPVEKLNLENANKYNSMYTKYVRFVIVHECYHILYNHVRRGILKHGANPTKYEHDMGNIAMDLEINRDIESTFEDLAGSTEVIKGIWYQNEKYFKSDGKMFKNNIWEEVWDDWIEHKKEFNSPSNPFNDESVAPKQKSNAQSGPYADGWRKAIDAIKKHQINPRTLNF